MFETFWKKQFRVKSQRSTNTPPRIFNMIIRKTKTTKPPVAAAMVVFMATWAANIPRRFFPCEGLTSMLSFFTGGHGKFN